jgi:2-octaprenyl-6-methoxyphenol hydroxylase
MQSRAPGIDDPVTADLAIVGGGLLGLTLACAAGGAGFRVAIIDREAPPRTVEPEFDGRASAIAFGSRRILEGIGVWAGAAAAAEPILEIRVADGASPLFLHYDHRDVGDEPLGHIVENRALRQALLARLAELPGVRHLAPAATRAVERGAGRVDIELEDGRRIAAPLVVSAEGRRATLREAAGIRTVEWSYPQAGIVCTVRHERPHLGVAVEHFLPSGPFAILPMTGTPTEPHRSSIVWTERAALAPGFVALDQAGFDAALAARFGDFLGAVAAVGPRWSYPLHFQQADRFIAGRLALVGDAAHVIHPIAGQGLNLGLRDVAALVEVLVDAGRLGLDIGAADILARYERWRRVDSLTLATVTDGLNRLFSNEVPPLKLARDLGLAAVDRLPPLKRFFMRHAMGLVGNLPRLVRGEPL